MGDHFCLKWNNHQENLTGIMTKLLDEQKFVDVSLVCEMKTFKAHQTVLSACSPYFEQVLEENPHPHPLIILRDVKENEMAALLQYMYRGEVSVRDDELSSFLHTARALKIRGLSESEKKLLVPQSRNLVHPKDYSPQNEMGSPPKRQKTTGKGIEGDAFEKLNTDGNQQQSLSFLGKSITKSSTGPYISQVSNYSDNLNELHHTDLPVYQQTIKQEVDTINSSVEDQNIFSHHQGKNDWAGTSSSANFMDPGEMEIFGGSKQWHIKCAFEKVDGNGFKCKICGQIKKHVRNHYLKHFPEHHECHLCRRTYTRKDNLNSHLKRDHFRRTTSSVVDSYNRLKRLSKRFDELQSSKSLTPDLFSHVENPRDLPPGALRMRSLASPPPGSPVDLSVRPNSVPIGYRCAPACDILPSFYNYFRF